MTIYIIFGPTGVGKTYIGNLLSSELKIEHVDGDKYITEEMRKCLKEDVQMTPEMIDRYADVLIQVINQKYISAKGEPFIISQALYLNKHRQQILASLPFTQMVYITSPDLLRCARIERRYQEKESKVSLKYAKDMDVQFEEPSHPVIKIKNCHKDKVSLLNDLMDRLPALENKKGWDEAVSEAPKEASDSTLGF